MENICILPQVRGVNLISIRYNRKFFFSSHWCFLWSFWACWWVILLSVFWQNLCGTIVALMGIMSLAGKSNRPGILYTSATSDICQVDKERFCQKYSRPNFKLVKNWVINQSINPWVNQSINQSVHESINQLSSRTINQSNNRWIGKLVYCVVVYPGKVHEAGVLYFSCALAVLVVAFATYFLLPKSVGGFFVFVRISVWWREMFLSIGLISFPLLFPALLSFPRGSRCVQKGLRGGRWRIRRAFLAVVARFQSGSSGVLGKLDRTWLVLVFFPTNFSFWFLQIRLQCWNVFFTFFVTLTVFPGVMCSVQQSKSSFIADPQYFMPVATIFNFAFFAFLGNLIPFACVQVPFSDIWWRPIAFTSFCNFFPGSIVCT